MSETREFKICREFFESQSAPQQALSRLKKGQELRLWLLGQQECALFFNGEKVLLEARAAYHPDVEFTLKGPAIDRLPHLPGSDMGRLGVEVLRLIADGQIKIKVCGSLLAVLRGGYIKIILDAGPEFSKFLADYGLSSMTKITSLIKKMKG